MLIPREEFSYSSAICLFLILYLSFGAVALALDLIPIAGLVFNFTSTIGAALWANDLEKKNPTSRQVEVDSSEEREVAVEIET